MGRHGYHVKKGAGSSYQDQWEEAGVRFVPCGCLNTKFCPAGLCPALLQRSALVSPGSLRDLALPGGSEPATLPGVLGAVGRMKAETPAPATRPLPVAESRAGHLVWEGETFSVLPVHLLPDVQFLFPHLCFGS